MTNERLFEHVRPWIEKQLGFKWRAALRGNSVDVQAGAGQPDAPLIGFKVDSAVAVAAPEEWLPWLRPVVAGLHADQLFSDLGAYELSRVTLPHGYAVWGPVPNYVADRSSWKPVADRRPRPLTRQQFEAVDWKVFWHCERNAPLASFGIYEGDRLVALTTVGDRGESVWEIGVDVAPEHKGRRLGSAVVSAAGNWIHDNGGIIHATVAFWNVPSSRNMRALGMEFVFSALHGKKGPFRVPPQPLGTPLPGVAIQDLYPRWAMNQAIQPKPE